MKETKQQSVFSRVIVAIPLAMLACFLWGSAFPCVKIGYRLFNVDTSAVPNIWMYAGVRFTMSGILIIAIMSIINRRFLYPKNRSQCAHVFWLSLTQTSPVEALRPQMPFTKSSLTATRSSKAKSVAT